MDVCLNSLLPEEKKILVVNNGAYSSRAVEICKYYGLPFIDLKFPIDERPSLEVIERTLKENEDIALVYTTHNETGITRKAGTAVFIAARGITSWGLQIIRFRRIFRFLFRILRGSFGLG